MRTYSAREWAERLTMRVSPADIERLGRTMLVTIDRVSSSRWEAAVGRAAALGGDVRPEKMKALTDSFARELGAFGAGACGARAPGAGAARPASRAAGRSAAASSAERAVFGRALVSALESIRTIKLAAATPAVGTTATLLAAMAELAWFTGRAGDLILTVAALHGRPSPSVEERRAWMLAVLIYGGSAREGFAKTINEANTGLSPANGTKLPMATLQTVNRLLTPRLVKRYGARRGAIALGTTLPLGIGAIVGGSANYMAVRALARHADQFFSRLPYSAIDATATSHIEAWTAISAVVAFNSIG